MRKEFLPNEDGLEGVAAADEIRGGEARRRNGIIRANIADYGGGVGIAETLSAVGAYGLRSLKVPMTRPEFS